MRAVLTLLVIVSLTSPTQVAERELVASLNLRPGMTVVNIGADNMLPFLRDAVGPLGKLVARDGLDSDPKLAVASVDVVLVLDAYQHFDHPEQLLAHLRSAIKPGGRLYIVDRLERDEAAKEIEANGFELLSTRDHSANQYVLTFARP